jgi:hypothetical protein
MDGYLGGIRKQAHVPHRMKNRANSEDAAIQRNGAWTGLDLLMTAFPFVLSFWRAICSSLTSLLWFTYGRKMGSCIIFLDELAVEIGTITMSD